MRIVIKAITFDHAYNRMRVAGMKAQQTDGEGRALPYEYMVEKCVRPPIECADGQVVFVVNAELDHVDRIPENDTPNFDVMWREDIGGTYPEVEVNCEPYEVAIAWDEDGKPTDYETLTTRMHKVGRIV